MYRHTIDRFEQPQWAVLEDDSGRTFTVPRVWLPEGATEGAVLDSFEDARDTSVSVVRFQLNVEFAMDPARFLHGQRASSHNTDYSRLLPAVTAAGSQLVEPTVCQMPLPAVASCVNDRIGPAEALCSDRAFSCSSASGTCSGHGGVYCFEKLEHRHCHRPPFPPTSSAHPICVASDKPLRHPLRQSLAKF